MDSNGEFQELSSLSFHQMDTWRFGTSEMTPLRDLLPGSEDVGRGWKRHLYHNSVVRGGPTRGSEGGEPSPCALLGEISVGLCRSPEHRPLFSWRVASVHDG